MSKLPGFVNEAAVSLQNLKAFRYLDFSLVSGRYFDESLLLKGFLFIWPYESLSFEVFTASSESERVDLLKEELFIASNIYDVKFCAKNSSYLKISVAGHFLSFTNSVDGHEELYWCECHPVSENKQHLTNLFTEFQASFRKEGTVSKFRTDSLLRLLIADTLDLADGHRQKHYEKGKSRESFNKLSVYLRENMHLPFDSSEVSKSLDFSVQYLNLLAHEYRNMSLKELVNFYRLEMAREVLLTSDSPVAELASGCGFKSAAYFIKLFRQTYGITPLQCRKKLRHRDSRYQKEFHRIPSFQEILPLSEAPQIKLDLDRKVTISIVNSSAQETVLSWLNPDGTEVEMHRLKPAQRIHLGTGYKECWSVRESCGKLIAYYFVPDVNCQIII